MGSDPKLAESGRHQCDNCHKVWRVSELKDFCDLMERLQPGGVVPSGECPECHALCYPYEPKKRVVEIMTGFNDKTWVLNKVTVHDAEVDLENVAAVDEFAKGRLQLQLNALAKIRLSFLFVSNFGRIEADNEYVPAPPPVQEPQDGWNEDENYPRKDWQYQVAEGNTNLGYWEWVAHQQEMNDG